MTLSRFDNDNSRPSISVSTRSGLTYHLARTLVGSESAPRRLTKVPVVRPLRELDLAHDDRPNEVRECRLGATQRRRERCRLSCEWHQLLQKLRARRCGEAGAHLADVGQTIAGGYAQ